MAPAAPSRERRLPRNLSRYSQPIQLSADAKGGPRILRKHAGQLSANQPGVQVEINAEGHDHEDRGGADHDHEVHSAPYLSVRCLSLSLQLPLGLRDHISLKFPPVKFPVASACEQRFQAGCQLANSGRPAARHVVVRLEEVAPFRVQHRPFTIGEMAVLELPEGVDDSVGLEAAQLASRVGNLPVEQAFYAQTEIATGNGIFGSEGHRDAVRALSARHKPGSLLPAIALACTART